MTGSNFTGGEQQGSSESPDITSHNPYQQKEIKGIGSETRAYVEVPATGSVNVNVLPSPGVESTPIRPHEHE